MMKRTFAMLWGLGILAGMASHAGAQAWDLDRARALPGWVWADAQQLDLSQARISVRTFQAPVSPVEAARILAVSLSPGPMRLQWAGSMLLLSGGLGSEHWLAQLQPQAVGTAGLVSRLIPVAQVGAGFDPAALAPVGARQMLQVRGRAAANPASLSSFDCPGSLDQVAAAVRRALHAAGWSLAQPAGAARLDAAANAAPLQPDWRHPRHGSLSVHLHSRARSVALTFWHQPQEPS